MVTSVQIGKSVLIRSNPQDVNNNGPAAVAPGTLGNAGTQWLVQTSGKVTKVEQGIEGIDCIFTGVALGSTDVIIHGNAVPDNSVHETLFTINVVIGSLDHFAPTAEKEI